jgi:hypothetical protein
MANAQTTERCFAETGQCIVGRIREYWEKNGGLSVFGLPVTPQRQEQVEGKPIQLQWFERNRLELHPENQRPYDILIGRLGEDRLRQTGRDWRAFSTSVAQPKCRFFAETGHNICGEFLALWQSKGLDLDGRRGVSVTESLALFGLPLSDVFTEIGTDGKSYQSQWFERARFELHSENQAPYRVLLGLLGNELNAGAASAQPVVTAPAPSTSECPPAESPVRARINSTCVRGGDLFVINAQGLRPGEIVDLYAHTNSGARLEIAIYAADAVARDDGSYTLKAALPSGIAAGAYSIYVHGNKSGSDSIAPIVVSAGPPTGKDYSILPPSIDADANPPVVSRGGLVKFNTYHFPQGNRVGVYITFVDDGSISGAPFTIGTDKNGGIQDGLRLATGDDDRYGLYVVTFEVLATGQKAYTYLRIVP